MILKDNILFEVNLTNFHRLHLMFDHISSVIVIFTSLYATLCQSRHGNKQLEFTAMVQYSSTLLSEVDFLQQ